MLFLFHSNTPSTLEAGLDAALTALIFAQDPVLLFYCSPLKDKPEKYQKLIRERFSTLSQSGLTQVFIADDSFSNDIAEISTQVVEQEQIHTLMEQHEKILSF